MQPDEQFDTRLGFAEAAILAGGASRRMGQDKTLLPIGNRSLIEIVAAQLTSLFHRVRIIANEEEKFADLNLPIQPDIRPGCGPLGGIHSALATAQQDTVFVAGCDFPFLTTSFIKGLAELLGTNDVVLSSADLIRLSQKKTQRLREELGKEGPVLDFGAVS